MLYRSMVLHSCFRTLYSDRRALEKSTLSGRSFIPRFYQSRSFVDSTGYLKKDSSASRIAVGPSLVAVDIVLCKDVMRRQKISNAILVEHPLAANMHTDHDGAMVTCKETFTDWGSSLLMCLNPILKPTFSFLRSFRNTVNPFHTDTTWGLPSWAR